VAGWVALLALVVAGGLAVGAEEPKVGDKVPDLGAPDENGKEVKLSSYVGKSGVVVYFYPKAGTPG
jgi:peroxiredoxin Q/BCP